MPVMLERASSKGNPKGSLAGQMRTEVAIAEIRADLKYLVEGHNKNEIKLERIEKRLINGAVSIGSTKTSVKNLWIFVSILTLALVVKIVAG